MRLDEADMGFGTVFIGYFLLLNIAYYSLTDLIAALIMALGFYKLSGVNRFFKLSSFASVLLMLVGLAELISEGISVFTSEQPLAFASYLPIPRAVIIAILSILMLLGIREVADEVKLHELSKKANISVYATFVIYLLYTLLEIPGLDSIIKSLYAVAILGVIAIISAFCLTVSNLTTIYTAYMRICMPGEDEDTDGEGFFGGYKKHLSERQKEYAEYKIKKSIEKSNKKKD